MPMRSLSRYSLTALIALLVIGLTAGSAIAQPGDQPAAPPQPQPGAGGGEDGGGGDPAAGSGGVVGVEEEPKPLEPWEQSWNAIDDAYLNARTADPINEADCAAVAESIRDFLKEYGQKNANTTSEAVRRLATLFGDLQNMNLLQIAIGIAGDLQDLEALTTEQRLLLLARRVDLLMQQGLNLSGDEKIRRYEMAVSGASTLVTRDLRGLPIDEVADLYLNQGRALAKMGQMDQAYARWVAGARRENDEQGRRYLLLTDLALWLVDQGQWELLRRLVDVMNELYPEEERNYTQRTDLLIESYLAAAATEDYARIGKLRKELSKLGTTGYILRMLATHTLRVAPGTRANPFYLYGAVNGTAHQLRQYKGRHVLMVFINPADQQMVRMWPALLEATQRFSERQLAVVTVALGKSFGNSRQRHLDLIERYKPRGDYLIDQSGSVSRSYSFGVVPGTAGMMQMLGGAVLVDGNGVVVRSVHYSVRSFQDDMIALRDALELGIELTTRGGKAITTPDGPEEASPEFELLKSLYESLRIPGDSPIRKARSVEYAGLMMGDDGRGDARALLATMYREAAPENQPLILSLMKRLRDPKQ